MSRHESFHRLALGALMLTVVVVLGALYAVDRDADDPALVNTANAQTDVAVETPMEPGQANLREGAQRTTTEPQQPSAAIHQDTLICRRADDRAPLAGISLYQNDILRLGPTGADGKLLIGDLGWDMRILWGEGWAPQRLRGAANPPEVLFVPADSKIDISLKNTSPQHKVIRSILQMRGADTPPEGIWTPKLEVTNWDRLNASQVPPGTYDIYVWISKDMGTPEPYQLHAVTLNPAQHLQLTIDLIADKQDTHEDDS